MLSQPNFMQGQSMKLSMTPRLIQTVNMLQMSAMELSQFIQERALENPFLDVDFGFEPMKGARPVGPRTGEAGGAERISADRDTLEAVLLSQLRIAGVQGRRYQLAAYLAGNLNAAGYLTVTLEEAGHQLGVPMLEVEAALRLLQALEPAGIGARSLQECLLLQMARDPAADSLASEMVSRFLDELAGGRLQRIADALDIPAERVKQALAYIRTLHPRPGMMYDHHSPKYVTPDAAIRWEQDDCKVALDEKSQPKITINRVHAGLTGLHEHPSARRYAREHLREAQWLVRSVAQRKATLLRVIEAIAHEQRSFLEKGRSELKPMNLKKIAGRLGLDESTVSRAVSGKYVQTPHGVFELKAFFTSGLSTCSGEETSSESIKVRIRQLIEAEDTARPLSDQQITDLLVQEGIRISRRTVMKYREELRILSSKLRRCVT
ncbi:RNA polymerase factor sigma-54 [Paenibacillus terreus]|uniref:RNA polymerase factor sigma-54 n=1 Tax=Paenibacillus terreus TaxID=1387834 RepID=A0ABV5BCU9_9BACL